MILSDAMAACLVKCDVGALFGVSGDANLLLVDSYITGRGGSYFAATSEAEALCMAGGYSMASGGIGVCTVTQGPGATGTVSALVEAVKAGSRVLLIAGDTARTRGRRWKDYLQDVDQVSLFRGAGAAVCGPDSPAAVLHDLGRAIARLRRHAGPVVLNVPSDFLESDVDGLCGFDEGRGEIQPASAEEDHQRAAGDLDEALGVLASSRRPILLAGMGVGDRSARTSILNLARVRGAAVATTLKAKDLFAGEPACLGVFGTLSTDAALTRIVESDCVAAFGASLNPMTTDFGDLLRGKALIQCDRDPAAMGRYCDPSVAIIGDAGGVADQMSDALKRAGLEPSSFASVIEADPAVQRRVPPREDSLIELALARVDESLAPERFLSVDVGRFMRYAWRWLAVQGANRYLHAASFDCLGLAPGTALGAAVYGRGTPSVAVVGDGGFMMGASGALDTALRYGLRLVIVVVNDGAYGSEYRDLKAAGRDPSWCVFARPDYAALAESMGARGVRVTGTGDLGRMADALREVSGPVVVDLVVDRDEL